MERLSERPSHTPRQSTSSQPQPATHNLLRLSRQLNTSTHKGHGIRFRTSMTLPQGNDEQLQLGALFLKYIDDPLATIPIVVEMRRKFSPMSTRSCDLNGALTGCFEEWLLPYLTLQLEVNSCYHLVMTSKCNKLGNIFLACLEREQRQLAEDMLARNINHLQLVQECFGSLLCNVLPKKAASEFVLRFLKENEQLFLVVLIQLLRKACLALKRSYTAKELVEALQEHFEGDTEVALQACRTSVSKEFAALFSRLARRFCYDS